MKSQEKIPSIICNSEKAKQKYTDPSFHTCHIDRNIQMCKVTYADSGMEKQELLEACRREHAWPNSTHVAFSTTGKTHLSCHSIPGSELRHLESSIADVRQETRSRCPMLNTKKNLKKIPMYVMHRLDEYAVVYLHRGKYDTAIRIRKPQL